MSTRRQLAMWMCSGLLCATVLAQTPAPATPAAAAAAAGAKQAAEAKSGTSETKTSAKAVANPTLPTVQGEELDRVVAIVNGDLVLDSDVNQEQRFQALLPYGEASGEYNRDKAIERLINRDLILQQLKLQPELTVTDEEAKKDLDNLKKAIPRCKQFQCETEAGWTKFLASEGFTEQSLLVLWKRRMEVLAFIEERFREGITITPAQIKKYYDTTMLPQYAKANATPAPLASISSRIQQVLLQQQVSALLNDWLDSLRSQGSVIVLHPGEGAP